VRSSFDLSDLHYTLIDGFDHPVLERIGALPVGFTPLPSRPGDSALDYVRAHLTHQRDLRTGGNGAKRRDLPTQLDMVIQDAIEDPSAMVYAFGSRWGPKPWEIDRTFADHPIDPSDGVHDVHMNQGNRNRPGRADDNVARENGVWQDGALFVHFGAQDRWAAVFLAFRDQSWQTDDRTGQPLFDDSAPAQGLRIVAALVNPVGPAPERELVTILNPAPNPVDLLGWSILNSDQAPTLLSGQIRPQTTLEVVIDPTAALRNRGGTISLIDPSGKRVSGVAYTTRQAQRDGYLIVFEQTKDDLPHNDAPS
jgi:uncharacterized protein YukJ